VTVIRPFALALIALAMVACTAPAASPSAAPSGTTAPTATTAATPSEAPSASPTAAATASPSEAPSASPSVAATESPSQAPVAACGPIESLPLKNPGRLTLSTDNPAFPPWWGGDPAEQYPNEPAEGSGWETSDPYSMMGYEGATAYALAAAMGFGPELVDWIPNANFENAFAPGEKPFDFHMAQISINEERAAAVDFTEPYFQANQALIAMTPNAITAATTLAELKEFQLGAARNTTSLDLIEEVIVPNVEPRALPNNANALRALQNGQIDGLVVDLSTAFFMRDAQLEDYGTPEPESTIVGQFSTELQADPVGAVLQLDSPLTDCVNAALAQIQADGTLDAIYDEWIVSDQAVPFLE
jgi:polar amino acid transport system substrate-binding protein